VGLVIVGGFLFLRLRSQDSNAEPSASALPASSVAELEALLDSPAGSATVGSADPRNSHIMSKTSLPDAIDAARPMMSNTVGRLDVGSALLAMWASKNLSWQALEALPETSPALFKKDPDAERGRRFCLSGTVLEIRAEKTMANRLVEDKSLPLIEQPSTTMNLESSSGSSYMQADPLASASASSAPAMDPLLLQGMDFAVPDGGKVYFATLESKPEPLPEGNRQQRAVPRASTFVEVIAVRSSGNLVDGSDARVCGVLTGVTVPPSGNTIGAVMDASAIHRIVGMFDLPQNRAPNGVEVATQHG
jgi:hypothetical protein